MNLARYFGKSGMELDANYLDSLPGMVTIKVASPVNQDAVSLLVTKNVKQETDDGEKVLQFYGEDFVWREYRGFDLLDTSKVSFPLNRARLLLPAGYGMERAV